MGRILNVGAALPDTGRRGELFLGSGVARTPGFPGTFLWFDSNSPGAAPITSLALGEDDSVATYWLVLSQAPDVGSVSVSLSVSDSGALSLSNIGGSGSSNPLNNHTRGSNSDGGDGSGGGPEGNWRALGGGHSFTLSPISDPDTDDESVMLIGTVTSAGGSDYVGYVESLPVTITDND